MSWQDNVTDFTIVAHAYCNCGIKDFVQEDIDQLITNPDIEFWCRTCNAHYGLKNIIFSSSVIIIEEEFECDNG